MPAMDDIMELILDLVFDVLGWVLPLLGKFWFLILAFLGYRLFGTGKKQMTEGKPHRRLTPVESGGFPAPAPSEERKTVRASTKYEPVEEPYESLEGVGVEQEWAFSETLRQGDLRSVHVDEPPRQPERQEEQASPLKVVDPREGMKWAIIFGQPRSKAPYAPPSSRNGSI